jgi:hypothetical protein
MSITDDLPCGRNSYTHKTNINKANKATNITLNNIKQTTIEISYIVNDINK